MSQNPSPPSARAQSALQQLYEDANLRDELTDDEAQPLYQWAEAQIAQLDAAAADDAAFETSLEALRRLLKSINRFVGRRPFSTPDQQAEGLAKIAEHAQSLGYALPSERQSAFLQSQAATDNLSALSALLNEIGGAVTEAQAESAPTQDSAPVQRPGGGLRSRFSAPQTTIESSDHPNNPAADTSLPTIEPTNDEPSPDSDPSSGEPF
jgi:hypothetical protein